MALQFAECPEGGSVGQNEVLTLQKFLTDSPWDSGDVQREIQAVFAEELVPSAAEWSIGVVGAFDGSSFVKRGTQSVGVTPAGCVTLDQQLYLPAEWENDKQRRREARVPTEITYQSQTGIALELYRRTCENGHVQFDWVTADSHYGNNDDFLDALESVDQKYVVETCAKTTSWTVDPQSQVLSYSGQGRPPSQARRESVHNAKTIADRLATTRVAFVEIA